MHVHPPCCLLLRRHQNRSPARAAVNRTVAQRSSTTSPRPRSTRMATEKDAMRTIPSDYDDNQERWLTNVSVRQRFAITDTHYPAADRIVAEGLRPVLDVGCGDGELHRQLPAAWPWLGVDRSP